MTDHSTPGGRPEADLAKELENFQQIASSVLPPPGEIPRLPGLDIHGRLLPLNGVVGGDHIVYIDFNARFDLDRRLEKATDPQVRESLAKGRTRAGLLLADVAGHQITDATVHIGLHHAFLTGVAYELEMHGEVTTGLFEKLNTRFYQTANFQKFISVIYGEIAQNGDLLGELLTGEAPAKLPAPRQDLTPRPYTPFAATSSPRAPAELEPLPAQAPRFTELRWRFEGGDPALGNPLVQLVHEDGTPVLHNGWLPITSTRTGDLPFLYESDPTYKAAPTATERTHTFTFVYELPPELPLGTYRLRATGRVKLGGQVQDFTLDGSPFTVVPGALPLDVALVAEAGGVRLSITPRWPAADPVWAPSPNDEWQIGRFRMLDRGFGRGFVPVLGAVVTAAATVQSGADAPIPITLADNGLAAPSQGGEPWAAGDGPGLTGVAAGLGAGLYTVTVPAGAVEDAFGNRNEATSVERTAP